MESLARKTIFLTAVNWDVNACGRNPIVWRREIVHLVQLTVNGKTFFLTYFICVHLSPVWARQSYFPRCVHRHVSECCQLSEGGGTVDQTGKDRHERNMTETACMHVAKPGWCLRARQRRSLLPPRLVEILLSFLLEILFLVFWFAVLIWRSPGACKLPNTESQDWNRSRLICFNLLNIKVGKHV